MGSTPPPPRPRPALACRRLPTPSLMTTSPGWPSSSPARGRRRWGCARRWRRRCRPPRNCLTAPRRSWATTCCKSARRVRERARCHGSEGQHATFHPMLGCPCWGVIVARTRWPAGCGGDQRVWRSRRLPLHARSLPLRLPAGPKERLDSTAVSQPAIFVASMAALEKLKATEGPVRGGGRRSARCRGCGAPS